jgi:contactin associated protein-like 2
LQFKCALMKVELLCVVSETLYFNGSSLVYRNLTYHPIQSRKDVIKFRFKTAQPDGILIYSKGTQSDFFALQLVDNRLILNVNLGEALSRSGFEWTCF